MHWEKLSCSFCRSVLLTFNWEVRVFTCSVSTPILCSRVVLWFWRSLICPAKLEEEEVLDWRLIFSCCIWVLSWSASWVRMTILWLSPLMTPSLSYSCAFKSLMVWTFSWLQLASSWEMFEFSDLIWTNNLLYSSFLSYRFFSSTLRALIVVCNVFPWATCTFSCWINWSWSLQALTWALRSVMVSWSSYILLLEPSNIDWVALQSLSWSWSRL